MERNYTHITIVVDRSGSMSHVSESASAGVNDFITKQKAEPGDCTLMLIDFDAPGGVDVLAPTRRPRYHYTDWYKEHYRGALAGAPEYHLHARGNTALYDAMQRAINDTGTYLRQMPEGARPTKVFFVVMTDGAENASRETNLGALRSSITHQTDKYGWEFIFLGAGLSVAEQAVGMGILARNVVNYANTAHSHEVTYAMLSDHVHTVRGGGTSTVAGKVTADGTVVEDFDRTQVTK